MAGYICGPIFVVIAYGLFRQFKEAKAANSKTKANISFGLSAICAIIGILYLIAAIFG